MALRRMRGVGAAAASLVILLIAAGCGAEDTATDSTTPAPTVVNIDDVSLAPAAEEATPEVIASVWALPSIAPPSGQPTAAAALPPDYTFGADDLAAFVDAYRSAFPGADLDEATIDAAGAQLCSYLMRHAEAGGTVILVDALTEADLSEPGYARSEWVTALEIANTHYCGEFTVDFTGG